MFRERPSSLLSVNATLNSSSAPLFSWILCSGCFVLRCLLFVLCLWLYVGRRCILRLLGSPANQFSPQRVNFPRFRSQVWRSYFLLFCLLVLLRLMELWCYFSWKCSSLVYPSRYKSIFQNCCVYLEIECRGRFRYQAYLITNSFIKRTLKSNLR